MNWIDKILSHKPKKSTYAGMLSGNTPIFTNFGTDIFASDVVNQAIQCIVSEMQKLNPVHVRKNGNDLLPVGDDRQRILDQPNGFMTKSELIERMVWNLFYDYNSFAVPVYEVWKDKDGSEKRRYQAIYPIRPTNTTFIEDSTGRLFVKFLFPNRFETTLPYDDVIHVRYRYSSNDYMGGNTFGQPDHEALLKTLQLNNSLLDGVLHAMKSSFAVNGIVKYNTMMDDGTIEQNMKKFENQLKNSENGFLGLDIKNEFTPLKKEVKLVDNDTLKFIDEKILRTFGVPLSILSGDYTPSQLSAFYQKTLEPLIVKFSEAFTRVLFTGKERGHGNEIQFYPKDLIFMSVDQTLEMVRLLGDSGSLYENEKRVAFGLQPLKELDGVRMQSLNYVSVEIADQYQMKQEGTGGGEDEEQPV